MKIIIITLTMLLTLLTGCGQHGHKRAQKKIQKERIQKEKETIDLSDAVKATDEVGWDSAVAHKQFIDTARMRITRNNKNLTQFEQNVSRGHKKVPLRYRAHIQKLRRRNTALEQRLTHCPVTGSQKAWEDFTRLYNYDLQRLSKDIKKLTGYK